MSIRLRFTLLYNAILAVTLAVFGFALYSIQSSSTLDVIKKELRRSSETLGLSVLRTVTNEKNAISPGTNPINPGQSILPGSPVSMQQGMVPGESNNSTENGYPAQKPVPGQPGSSDNPASQTTLLNPDGSKPPANFQPPKPFSTFTTETEFQNLPEREIVRVLDASGNLVASPYGRKEDALPLTDDALKNLAVKKDWFETGDVANQQMLILNRAILVNGEVKYILQVARPLTERNHSLELLRNTLLGASLLTLLVAFGIGWGLSGITLQPIQRITRTARTIGEEKDFSRRVDYLGPQDEVGELAATTNSMLSNLQEAYQKVAQSLSQQRDFVADVSHELRTPLTTLRGNLGLLTRKPPLPADEQSDIVNDMVLESDRMIRLVNELLRLAHAEAGRNLKMERFSLAPVIDDCSRQIQTLDTSRRLTWSCHAAISIIGDRDAFKQVLLILLDNAMKHSSGDIDVTAVAVNTSIEVTVSNTGEGISPDKLEHVFDRFYRADEESGVTGFGLGLPIARSLVEALGGTIRIESQLGYGCRVIMNFSG